MKFVRRSAFTQNPVIADLRAEDPAGGILRNDGEINFFVRAKALAKLQGKAKKVIGIDIDEGLL
jgi:hypothetical protein